jgi:hypothetical protein
MVKSGEIRLQGAEVGLACGTQKNIFFHPQLLTISPFWQQASISGIKELQNP